jgi:diguanylate cyclase (GGDEF)-like protein
MSMSTESLNSWKKIIGSGLQQWDRYLFQRQPLDWRVLVTVGLYYSLVLNTLALAGLSLAFLMLPATMLIVLKFQRSGAMLATALGSVWMLIFLAAGWIQPVWPTLLLILSNGFAAYFTWKQSAVIHSLKGSVQRAEAESERDPLTGLLNRRGFDRQAERILQQKRGTDHGYALLAMDLDNFKRINDTFGHHMGDKVLKTFADSVKSVLRTEDLAGRMGGEEFVLLLNTDHSDELAMICQRVRHAVAEVVIPDLPDEWQVTFSGGLASSLEITAMPALMTLADQRLYAAKLNGKDQIQY